MESAVLEYCVENIGCKYELLGTFPDTASGSNYCAGFSRSVMQYAIKGSQVLCLPTHIADKLVKDQGIKP